MEHLQKWTRHLDHRESLSCRMKQAPEPGFQSPPQPASTCPALSSTTPQCTHSTIHYPWYKFHALSAQIILSAWNNCFVHIFLLNSYVYTPSTPRQCPMGVTLSFSPIFLHYLFFTSVILFIMSVLCHSFSLRVCLSSFLDPESFWRFGSFPCYLLIPHSTVSG